MRRSVSDQQLGLLGTSSAKPDSAEDAPSPRDVREILRKEVAIILVPHLSPVPPVGVRELAEQLSVRLVDLVERRMRGLPACDVCGDFFSVCLTCGTPEVGHGETEHQLILVPCEVCPFPALAGGR